MRAPISPFSSIPLTEALDEPDVIAYYRFDEALASSNLADEAGGAHNLAATANPGVKPPLFGDGSAATGARTFNGSTQFFQDTPIGNEFEDWLKAGLIGVTVLIKPDVVSGTQTILNIEDDSGREGLRIELLSTSEIRVTWDDGTERSFTSAAGIEAGKTYLLGVGMRPHVDTKVRLSVLCVQLDDKDTAFTEESSTSFGAPPITGGVTNITVGADNAGTANFFDGTMDELVFWNTPLTMSLMRDLAANYTARYDENQLYLNENYTSHLRCEVEDADGVFRELSDLEGHTFVQGFDYSVNVDTQVATAELSLRREYYNYSLAYGMTTSPLYGTGNIVDLARQVRVLSAVTPLDREPQNLDFTVQFEGFVDNISWEDEVMSVQLRDQYAPLADVFIEPDGSGLERAYGSGAGVNVETIMQSIIDDNEPSVADGGYWGKGRPQVVTPTTPGFVVKPFAQQLEPVGTALETLALLPGWRLAYAWSNTFRSYLLDFSVPERTSPSVVYTFNDDDYISVRRAHVNIDLIRNAISVGVFDSGGTADSEGIDPRVYPPESTNATSIGKYGRRWARIGEAFASYLDTDTEAIALADAVLADLAEPKTELEVTLPFFRRVQLNDYYRFSSNGIHFDGNLDLAVYGYTHSMRDGVAETTLQLRGKPAAKVQRWQDVILAPGVVPNLPTLPPEDANTPSVDLFAPGMFGVYWNRKVNRRNRNDDLMEIHVGGSSGFLPDSSTIAGVVRGSRLDVTQDPLTTASNRYVRIQTKDKFNNISAISTAAGPLNPRFTTERPLFQVSLNGDLGGSWTDPQALAVMNWGTIDEEKKISAGNGMNLTTDEYTIDVEGWWIFTCQYTFAFDTATLATAVISLEKDTGSGYVAVARREQTQGVAGVRVVHPRMTHVEPCAVGDTMRIRYEMTTHSGANFTNGKIVDNPQTYWRGALMVQD